MPRRRVSHFPLRTGGTRSVRSARGPGGTRSSPRASTVSFLRWHSLKPKGFDCKFLEVASTVSFLLLPLDLWPMPTPTTLDIFLEESLPCTALHSHALTVTPINSHALSCILAHPHALSSQSHHSPSQSITLVHPHALSCSVLNPLEVHGTFENTERAW